MTTCESYYVRTSSATDFTCADEAPSVPGVILEVEGSAIWLISCATMVFLMQLGFAMLEAGSVSRRNVQNILFKNLMDACLGAIVWFVLGYGFAYGKASGDNSFIGGQHFAYLPEDQLLAFFFQWAFCVTASTIVSGSVAERMKLDAYFVYTLVLTAFIYPCVVHWVWDSDGWMSAFNNNGNDAQLPIMDFAGSGVVHMVGGLSGLVGAIMVGPRPGRFSKKDGVKWGSHSVPFQMFGTLILWYGWYGFNCGSTLAVSGVMGIANLVAVTTTLAAAAGGMTVALATRFTDKRWSVGQTCNGILAGLVSITAPCPIVRPGAAIGIGLIGGLVYLGSSRLLIRLQIDDPLDAFPVHGACGFWGVISVGIFAVNEKVSAAFSDDMANMDGGKRFGYQFAGALMIAVWTIAMSACMFGLAKATVGLRVEPGKGGLDAIDFGTRAYERPSMPSSPAHKILERIVTGEDNDLELKSSAKNA